MPINRRDLVPSVSCSLQVQYERKNEENVIEVIRWKKLPKLRANKRHLPVWENKAKNLLITLEALRANPAYARARQKHEQELQHAEKVIT